MLCAAAAVSYLLIMDGDGQHLGSRAAAADVQPAQESKPFICLASFSGIN